MNEQLQRIRTDLIEKRLWPIALLLVAALVAVPVLLRHDPAPAPEPASAAVPDGPSPQATMAAASSVLGVEPPVTVKGAPKGSRRDPFAAPAAPMGGGGAAPRATSAGEGKGSGSTAASTPSSSPSTPTSSSSAGSGSSSPSPASPSPSSPAPSTASPSPEPRIVPPAPKPKPEPAPEPTTYRLLRTDVRFDGEPLHDVVRLRPLPGAKAPVALYLGPTAGGRGAAFVVSGGVSVDGDGRCRPRTRLCTHLILHPGEQVTLNAGETQHTLRLLRVRVERTTSQVKAERFYARQSERGRCVLDVLDYLGYDPESGTVAPHHDNRECEYLIGKDGTTVGAR